MVLHLVSLLLTAILFNPRLTVEVLEDDGMIFISAVSDIMKDGKVCH